MRGHAVLVAGGGPTGLMLAGELALAGVDVAIVERRTSQELVGSRAGGLHARTIEVLDQRGIADRFVSQGQIHKAVSFNMVRLDIADFPTRRNYTLALWQNHIERILAGWVEELEVPIYRGRELTSFTQDEGSVDIALSDGQHLTADYLVGCDGARSAVRKAAGIDFPGWEATTSWLIAEVEMLQVEDFLTASGTPALGRLDGGRVRVVLMEKQPSTDNEPTLSDVGEALVAAYGTDFGIHSPTWISRFTDLTRQAAAYRDGRVLLAGDAAHIQPPIGGQGLNIGVQDAVNLGWKLAQVVKLISPDTLLDTYHAERHPVAARVLRNTMAQVALRRQDDRTKALGETIADFLVMDEPRKRMAAEMSGLGVHYDLGEGHQLVGRRMPDLDIVTGNGASRIFSLLHDARPLLLNLDEPGGFDIGPWSDRVRLAEARYEGAWDLPALGAIPPPVAVLVRPDGYVAWVGDRSQAGLAAALTSWFGPSTAA